MKSNFKYYLVSWIILVVIFNVVIFCLPNEWYGYNKFGGAFWGAYVFIILAFVSQLLCAMKAFQAENVTKLFYSIPLVTISYGTLIAVVLIGTICFAIPDLPNWVAVIAGVVLLGLSAITIIKAQVAVDVVSGIDDKIKERTFIIKDLTVDADSLMRQVKNEETKIIIKKVYEAFRYSDPMSDDALVDDEARISKKFKELSDAIINEDEESARVIADDLIVLISSRNKKCKMLK